MVHVWSCTPAYSRLRNLPSLGPVQVLGVPRTATPQELKTACEYEHQCHTTQVLSIFIPTSTHCKPHMCCCRPQARASAAPRQEPGRLRRGRCGQLQGGVEETCTPSLSVPSTCYPAHLHACVIPMYGMYEQRWQQPMESSGTRTSGGGMTLVDMPAWRRQVASNRTICMSFPQPIVLTHVMVPPSLTWRWRWTCRAWGPSTRRSLPCSPSLACPSRPPSRPR